MNDFQYQGLLAWPALAVLLYLIFSIERDIRNWLRKMKEEEQLDRATHVEEGNKHYYLIRKTAPRYEIFVDEELIGTAETLRRAQELGAFEVQDRNQTPEEREAYKRFVRLITKSADADPNPSEDLNGPAPR
jgi:hypothetical protein